MALSNFTLSGDSFIFVFPDGQYRCPVQTNDDTDPKIFKMVYDVVVQTLMKLPLRF